MKYYEIDLYTINNSDKLYVIYRFQRYKVKISALDLQILAREDFLNRKSNMASRAVQHIFVSYFWLAHRTMLKFDWETKIKGMGKNKSKKGFFFYFFPVFSKIFCY